MGSANRWACGGTLALWLSLTAAVAGPTQVSTTVYRCTTHTGTLHYQGTPCGGAAQGGERRVLEHVQPEVPRTRDAARADRTERGSGRAGKGRRSRAARAARELTANAMPTAPTPRERRKSRREQTRLAAARCPATREDGGPTGSTSVAQAWKRHQALPSRTWLRNAGRWPRHCDDP